MVFRCSILGCKNTSATAITHCLPKDPEIRQKWCQAVKRNDLLDASNRQRHNFRICDIHFSEDAKFLGGKNRTNLKFNAVPTLYLEGISRDTTLIKDLASPKNSIKIEGPDIIPLIVAGVSKKRISPMDLELLESPKRKRQDDKLT